MPEDFLQDKTTLSADEVTQDVKTETPAETSKIYVGPNIPKEGLPRFRVYKGGLPVHLDELFTACPAVKRLFVDVDKLSEVLNLTSQTGSAYHTWYAEATNYVKGV